MFTIENIIDTCRDFNLGKLKKGTIEDFFKSLKISRRLSLYKKGMIVSLAMIDFDLLEMSPGYEEETAIDIEEIYVTRFILSYVETSEDTYRINTDDIDDLYNAGFVDYVLDYCSRDFDVLKRMFENAIKFKYINLFGNMVGNVSSEENTRNIEKISKIFEDKTTVSKVANIMQYNDPALKSLKDEIYKPLEKKVRKK